MIDLRFVLAVGVGAAIGGIARYVLTQLVLERAGPGTGPYATIFINVSGSFLIGVVIELSLVKASMPLAWRYFLATGILGGYTTFSTFSFEALAYWTSGAALAAVLYAGGSVILGILAAAAGIFATRALSP